MNRSRAALLPFLLLPLVACGSKVLPSADEAHTMACRGYVLAIGATDLEHVKELIAQAPYSGDDVAADTVLAKVRQAAVAAGTSPGLSAADFSRFRAVVEAMDGAAAGVKTGDDGTTTLDAAAILPLQKAVAAVHRLCY